MRVLTHSPTPTFRAFANINVYIPSNFGPESNRQKQFHRGNIRNVGVLRLKRVTRKH